MWSSKEAAVAGAGLVVGQEGQMGGDKEGCLDPGKDLGFHSGVVTHQ